ncbi:MAG: hypothetical protein C6W59_09465 [Paenibacillaceae bacterium]|nr:hypothetical protein [Thermobacillus xylanilyticus]REJ14902.1 MAG: hypothetical protein C6W59_09465 [Paenibacillaceae bacterium]
MKKETPVRKPGSERRVCTMNTDELIVIILMAGVLHLLVLTMVIRNAINQSKLTDRLAELTDEVRMLRRELAREKAQIIDKRV